MKKTLILLSICSMAAFAEEGVPTDTQIFHDIRVTLVGLPTTIDTHLENKSTNKGYDSTSTIDSAGELSIGYQFNHYRDKFGALIGANLDFITTKDEFNGATDTTNNVGPSLHIGLGFRPVKFFNLEGLLFAGLGSSSEDLKGVYNKDIPSNSGHYTKLGAELRAVFTMGPGFQLFLQGGYISLRQTLTFANDPSINLAELEVTNKAQGGTFGLGAGWRF